MAMVLLLVLYLFISNRKNIPPLNSEYKLLNMNVFQVIYGNKH